MLDEKRPWNWLAAAPASRFTIVRMNPEPGKHFALFRKPAVRVNCFMPSLRTMTPSTACLSDLERKMEALHILVNNASVFDAATFEESTPELWNAQMDSNAMAPFFIAQKAARLLRLQPQGKIVNLVDVAGETIWPGYLAYSVSKAALIAVNRGLAKALAPNIQVNGIAPGPVLFPEYYTQDQKHLAVERTLLKRAGSASDIVSAVVFLIENDYITGEVIHVDGGRHIM